MGLLGTVCAGVFLAGVPAWAGINSWSSTGPDGGWVYGVAWHPTRDGVMFAAAGRVYRSTDRGAHWSSVSPTGGVFGQFIFDPANPDRILASGGPLLRSTDGGASFTWAGSPPGGYQMQHLAIDSSGSVVYGAAEGGRVFRSSDFGLTWVGVSTGLSGPSTAGSAGLVASPTDPNTLYVSFNSAGLFKTTNAGASWSPVASLPGNIHEIAINPNNGSQLLAYKIDIGPQLWRSDDAGASWSLVLSAYLTWFGFDPLVVNRVFATDNANHRLLVSTDAGSSWLPAANIPSVQASAVGFNPTTTNVLAVGTAEGVYYSTSAGQTLTYRSTGIRSADTRAIAVSRSAPFQVYASFYAGPNGVHRRVPGGWEATNTAQLMAAFSQPTVIDALAVDPDDSSVVYAAGNGGVAKSTDAGNTWALLPGAFATTQLNAIAIDPSNSQVIYLAAAREGILRSALGGAAWGARNSGLPVVPPFGVSMRDVAINPVDPQRLYAIDNTGVLFRTFDAGINWTRSSGALAPFEGVSTVAFDPFNGNRIYMATVSALYQSLDSGVAWSPIPLPPGTSGIRSVLPDPEIPGTVTLIVESPAGVIRTVDGGATWERIPWENPGDGIPIWNGVLTPGQRGNLIVGGLRHGMREFQIAPDLSVSLSGIADRLPIGGASSLRVTVQNKVTSLFATSDATVSVLLPAVLVAGSVSSSRGACAHVGQNITCRVGPLKVGENAQIDMSLTGAAGAGDIIASVQVYEVDSLDTDNHVTLPVTVQPFADLRATVGTPTVNHGGSAVVDVHVMNLGPHASADTGVMIGLPTGLGTFSSFSNPLCSVGSSTSLLCEFGALPKDGSATIQVPVTGVSIGVHEMTVTATSSTQDPVTDNNIVNRSITVRPVTDLAVTLGNVPGSVIAGQTVSVTATVANNGPDPLNVVVATLSGAGLSVTAATPNGGSCSITGGAASCSLGALAAGASRTIDVTLNATVAGAAQVTASIDSEGSDSTAGNNSAVRSVTITAVPSAGGGAGSSGGGGALGLWGLLAMLSWASARGVAGPRLSRQMS